MTDHLEEVLGGVCRQYLDIHDDPYVRKHVAGAFLSGTVRFFRFYQPWLSGRQVVLDWGCRHAPDACLIREMVGAGVELYGCDVVDPAQYEPVHRHAGLKYRQLTHPFQLPYADEQFDAVIASGVLEHVPMDYESLKELHRVLKPKGVLVVGYLPSTWSVEEWWLRLKGRDEWHRHLYSKSEFHRLLMRSGLLPLKFGFQTQLDMLPLDKGTAVAILKPLLRLASLHRLTNSLCAVAEKTLYF